MDGDRPQLRLSRFASSSWLAGAVFVTLAAVPAWAGASCQTWWCAEQRRQQEEERLQESRAEALADPRAGAKWADVYGLLTDAAERRRSMAAFRARLDWTPQPVLDRWPELEEQIADERDAWLERWRDADPEGTERLCSTAGGTLDPVPAFQTVAAAQKRRPDDRRLVACLVERSRDAGRSEVGLAAAQKLVELRGDELENWYLLLRAASDAGADEIAMTARLESAKRFPERPRLRADVLRSLRDAHADQELERMTALYLSEAVTPAQVGALCDVLDAGSNQAESCYRSVLAAPQEGQPSREDQDAINSAHWKFLRSALDAKDLPQVERLIRARSPQSAASDWYSAVQQWDLACPAFLGDVRSGRLTVATADRPVDRPFHYLIWALAACQSTSLAHELLDAAGAGTRAQSINERVALLERRGVEESLAADPNDVYAQSELDRTSFGMSPADRIAYFSKRLQAAPERAWLRQDLLKALEDLAQAGQPTQAVESANRSRVLLPSDLDWALQVAFLDFRWKDWHDAGLIASEVLRAQTATVRQRDEAEFLLARLDRRAGRYAQASARLERYFLDRVRNDVCVGCDVAMGLDLLASFDRSRLISYLARRAEAVTYFRNVVAMPAGIGYGRQLQRPWPEASWPEKLVAAPLCRQEESLDRLRATKAGLRPIRLSDAEKLPPCPVTWGSIEMALDGAAPEQVWQSLTRVD